MASPRMALLVQLRPSTDPAEILLPGLRERPILSLRSDDEASSSVVLGRGPRTGIADGSLSEAVVELSFDEHARANQQVKATLLEGATGVHLTGMLWEGDIQSVYHLSHGDVISLDDLSYEYKISITEVPPLVQNPSPPNASDSSGANVSSKEQGDKRKLSDSNSRWNEVSAWNSTGGLSGQQQQTSIPLSPKVASQLSDEIQCSVCLEIQVHPRTINPCGHSFCTPCLKQLQQCPQCRHIIMSHVPARQLESLINTLVAIPNLLDAGDVKQYRERQNTIPKMQTASCGQAMACKRQRRGHRGLPPRNPSWDMFDPVDIGGIYPPTWGGSSSQHPLSGPGAFRPPPSSTSATGTTSHRASFPLEPPAPNHSSSTQSRGSNPPSYGFGHHYRHAPPPVPPPHHLYHHQPPTQQLNGRDGTSEADAILIE